MKKLSLLLVVLLAAGSAGLYGQMAIGTNFSISGNATATAGYDIDDEQFGFKNEMDANIKIELVAKQSSMKPEEMMSGWYGSIELNDFQIIIDSDEEDSTEFVATESMKMDDGTTSKPKKERTHLYVSEPDIVATLKNGPLWLKIYSDPDNKADLIPHIEEDEDNDKAAESHDKDKDVGSTELFKGSGIALGYTTADLSFGIGISSEETYDADVDPKKPETANAETGSFAVSANLMVNVGPAQLDLAFVQGLENGDEAEDSDKDDDTGVGAKLTTTFGDVSLSAGADILMTGEEDNPDTSPDNESMDWEGGGNATVTLTPNSSLKSDVILSSVGDVATDVKVVMTDTAGLVENLDLSLTWGLFDITNGNEDMEGTADDQTNDKSDLTLEGKIDYHLVDTLGGTLTPGTTVTVDQVDGGDAAVGLEVRAVLKEAVPATEFGLKWKSSQLVDTETKPAQSGTITLWTKISY